MTIYMNFEKDDGEESSCSSDGEEDDIEKDFVENASENSEVVVEGSDDDDADEANAKEECIHSIEPFVSFKVMLFGQNSNQ